MITYVDSHASTYPLPRLTEYSGVRLSIYSALYSILLGLLLTLIKASLYTSARGCIPVKYMSIHVDKGHVV